MSGLEAKKARGFILRSENPRLTSSFDPSIMVTDADKSWLMTYVAEKNVLADIPGTDWKLLYPGAQAVPEDGDGVHFLLSPRRSVFCTPENLTVSDLTPAMNFLKIFLEGERTMAAFNISSDPLDRRPQSQRWANLHFHGFVLPTTLEGVNSLVAPWDSKGELLKLREQSWVSMERILQEVFVPKINVGGFEYESKHGEKLGNYVQRGGVCFRVKYVSGERLAESVKLMDKTYRDLHKVFFGAFASNYSQVQANNWNDGYVLRPRSEMASIVGTIEGLSENSKRFLMKVGGVLKQNDPEGKDSRIYRAPSYSVGMVRDGSDLMVVFNPHILRIGGAVEVLGIAAIKDTVEGVSIEGRRTRDIEVIGRTLARL